MVAPLTALQVECYAGYRGEETPKRLAVWGRAVEVVDVLDRWLAPDHRYFKLLGSDGGTYIIKHNERDDSWELTVYKKRDLDSTLLGKPFGPS